MSDKTPRIIEKAHLERSFSVTAVRALSVTFPLNPVSLETPLPAGIFPTFLLTRRVPWPKNELSGPRPRSCCRPQGMAEALPPPGASKAPGAQQGTIMAALTLNLGKYGPFNSYVQGRPQKARGARRSGDFSSLPVWGDSGEDAPSSEGRHSSSSLLFLPPPLLPTLPVTRSPLT